MAKPICLMIMPYGRKATQAEAGHGVPEIDFDALWDRAFAPTIIALGYEPVRGDLDTNALIINQVIERLYFADLVLADMTIPNGNVYYQIGIRHAAKEKGCVLLAADWSKPLLDVAQMRTIRYPLADGSIDGAAAQAISSAIRAPIHALARGGSPVFDSIRGYPSAVDQAAATTMKDVLAEFAAFQGEMRAIRALPRGVRMDRAKELAAQYWKPPVSSPTALTLLRMLRDTVENENDWSWLTDFISKAPPEFAAFEEVRELDALAISNAGKPIEAIAKLEGLISTSGPTSERLGLIGGRYKRLYANSENPAEKLHYLNTSIEAYERGMEFDLNEYYCSCNLPRLYKARKRKGDDAKAQAVSQIVVAACKRAKHRGLADEWLRPTLLGAAFDAGDCDEAEELAAEVAAEGAVGWKVNSMLWGLQMSVSLVEDEERRKRLAVILQELKSISAG